MASKHLTEDEIRYTVDVKTAAAQKEIYRLEQQSKKLRSENKARLSQMIQLEAAGKKETDTYKNLKKQYTETGKEIRNLTSQIGEQTSKLNVLDMTMSQLKKQQKSLQKELENTSKTLNPELYGILEQKLQEVSSRMAELKQNAKSFGELAASDQANGMLYGNMTSDGTTATLDRSLMGEQITIRCRAKYSAAGNPSAVQLTDASPSKVITIARRVPPVDVEILDTIDTLQPGTRNFNPRAYIYDNVGEIPNPTKDILPIWYFGTNSHTKAIDFVQQGHGLNPTIPTDLMDAKLGGILQIDPKILNPLALLADGDGKVITDGDGKAIVFH